MGNGIWQNDTDGTKVKLGSVGQQLSNGVTNTTSPVWTGVISALLADSNSSLTVGQGNQFIAQTGLLTANRTKTLDVAGATLNESITIVRYDTSNKTLAVVNGGPGGGTLYTFPANVARQCTFVFNGTDWVQGTHQAIS